MREEAIAGGRLTLLVRTLRRKMLWLAGLNLWQNALSYATILLPAMLLAPRYFAGDIEFGVVSQVRGVWATACTQRTKAITTCI